MATATKPKPTDQAAPDKLWSRFRVSFTLDRLVGGIPASSKTMEAWLDKSEITGPAREEQTDQLTRNDNAELHSVVFWRTKDGAPAYEGRCLKAGLKEAANVLKTLLNKTAYRSKLAERVFVEEKFVLITNAIQSESRPISVMTAKGPRTSLKNYEFVEDQSFTFHLRVLNDDVFHEEELRTLFEYMQDNGLGADRSQGSGTFTLNEFVAL